MPNLFVQGLPLITLLLYYTLTTNADISESTINPELEIARPAVGQKIASHNTIYYQQTRPRDGYYIAQPQVVGGGSGFVRWWNGILNDVIVNRGYAIYDPRRDYDRRRDYYYYTRQRQGYWIPFNSTLPPFPPQFVPMTNSSLNTTTTSTTTTTTTTTPPPYIVYYIRQSSRRSFPSSLSYPNYSY